MTSVAKSTGAPKMEDDLIYTTEMIAAVYAAMLDSVAVINESALGPASDRLSDLLARNVSHLQSVRYRDFWLNEDMAPIDAAIALGQSTIAQWADS
jgi:hypothetical protein